MNDAHLHLMLNHFPIVLPIVGAMLIIGGFIFKSEIMKRSAYAMVVLGAILAFATFSTGEEAEEIAEHISGVSHRTIHEHEEMAEVFAMLMYLLGGISLVGFWASWKKKSFSNILSGSMVVAIGVVMYFGMKTGTSGGEIRHPEINNDYSVSVGDESHETHEEAH